MCPQSPDTVSFKRTRWHTFGSLLHSRKAVGVRKKTGMLFAWMSLAVLLVGCLPWDAPLPGDPDTTSQDFGEGWTPAANSVHVNPRITCSADPTPANAGNAVGASTSLIERSAHQPADQRVQRGHIG